MEKPAETAFPVHELIRRRWSPVGFDPRPVPKHTLLTLLEAARWAPSSFNDQPWAFLVATKENEAEFRRLLDCLTPGNQLWAQHAAALLISLARLHFAHNGRPNRHAWHDVGLATENLALQAVALGLQAHAMAGIEGDKIRERYAVPEGWEPVAGIAVGYPSSELAHLPEKLQQRQTSPRSRRALSEFVFTGRFGEPLL
ncbi:MAG: nitroreductase family protein [Firmicutes bacterium]|nr:nitroreductase family protein [Bacillota bacterium]